MSKTVKSSIPGLIYPSGRDYFMKTSFGFLNGKRTDDGAEGLWRIYNNLYDLESFITKHPGGSEWIAMTRGTDITEAFEAHHVTNKAERLLPKYFVRKTATPRAVPYTFESSGFYRTFKEKARETLKNVNFHSPSPRSKLIADVIVTLVFLSAVAAAIFESWIATFTSAVFLTWTSIIAHNFFHMRDNFRMYYFDLSMMSSKDWRVSHVLSHHMYPNTIWDMEIYSIEPFFRYLPRADKSFVYKFFSIALTPLFYALGFLGQGFKRYYSVYAEWKNPEFRDFVPFFIPLLMLFFATSTLEALKIWLSILILSSFMFSLIGLNAAHHHPEIFHDGDVCRNDLDWGLMEMDAVRDRHVIDDSLFLVLTNFGSHGLHHLLPTVDHDYLQLCVPAFHETCREFGIDSEKLSQWELVKGQFKQLVRTEPRANYRGGPDGGISRSR